MSAGATATPVMLTIVVPAFDEVANIEPVIRRTVQALDAAPWVGRYQIVVVNDGSRDGTGEAADRLAAGLASLQVVHHPSNQGFGAALRSGYACATGEFCTAIPADGEVEVEQALLLLKQIGAADVVASRRERTATVRREALTRIWHLGMRLLVGFDLRGVDGIYVIRTSLLRQLTLRSTTGLVNLEILMQCSMRGVPMVSGVMRASPRLSGASKVANLPTMAKILWEMLRLRVAMQGDLREG